MAPLRLKSMNHISRICSNVAVSKAFYENVLGFVEVVRPSQLEDTLEGCWLFGYNVGIHLIDGEPLRRSTEINPRDDHMSFQCDSFSDVVEVLDKDGTPYVQAQVCHQSYVINQVFFHDPDHNMIEICTCECMPVTPLHRGLAMDQCVAAKPDAEMVPTEGVQQMRTRTPSFLELAVMDLAEEITFDQSSNVVLPPSPSPQPHQPPSMRATKCA